jgi:hypothetical protein
LAPGHIGGCRVQLKSIAVLNQIGESISWQTGIIAHGLVTFIHVIREDGGVALSITDVM